MISFITRHLWVNHQVSDKMREEKGLKSRKKTEEKYGIYWIRKKTEERKKKHFQGATKVALSERR
jgi:hypothetical protein